MKFDETSGALDFIASQLTPEDDKELWQIVLSVLAEEARQWLASTATRRRWYLQIGACSHWQSPHQTRWTAKGGFAWPGGYDSLPEFDWSRVFQLDGTQWVPATFAKTSLVLRATVPTRTARHNQAVIHTVWPYGARTRSRKVRAVTKQVGYGFRKLRGEWVFVAAYDEPVRGRVVVE